MALDNTRLASLADVLIALNEGDFEDSLRHRARISAIHRIATFLHRPPCDLPTDVKLLRAQLEALHPAQCGVTAKSLSNIKSGLADALKATGVLPDDPRELDRSDAWEAFLGKAASDQQRWGIMRFVGYCCARKIEPDNVTQEIFDAYRLHLDDRLLTRSPAVHCKAAAGTWNHLVKLNTLPFTRLDCNGRKRFVARPLSDYPISLQDEIETYLAKLAHQDIFAEGGPDKALRPTSIRNIRAHLAQYLDALVSAGAEPSELTCLRKVVSAEQLKTAFRAIQKRRGTNAIPTALPNIAATLTAIARHHLSFTEAEMKGVLEVKKRVSTEPRGMSPKNAQRLGQFDHWEKVVLLVSLAPTLLERANANPHNRKSALEAMHAAALAILLSCPMRVKNLAGLDLDRHLRPHLKGTHTIYAIRIEGVEVKNGEPIEVVLNVKMSRLLHRYITQFRPQLSKVKGTALFPRQSDGKPREPGNFSDGIIARIKRETGLCVHPHLFRHLAAMLYLKERPGDFETVRRMLKHKRLQTTMDFYASISNQWAHEHYDSVVLSKFGGGND